jgi:RNA-directed DNA polymerase
VSEPKQQDKSFQISKWVVWEAFQRVKANKGAAGVDEQSIAEFEQDRDANLYRIWNRLSSGSYFPPPVKAVEIAKAGGKGALPVLECECSAVQQGADAVVDQVAETQGVAP